MRVVQARVRAARQTQWLARARDIGQARIQQIEARHVLRRLDEIMATMRLIEAELRLASRATFLEGQLAQSFAAWVDAQAQETCADDVAVVAQTRFSVLSRKCGGRASRRLCLLGALRRPHSLPERPAPDEDG